MNHMHRLVITLVKFQGHARLTGAQKLRTEFIGRTRTGVKIAPNANYIEDAEDECAELVDRIMRCRPKARAFNVSQRRCKTEIIITRAQLISRVAQSLEQRPARKSAGSGNAA